MKNKKKIIVISIISLIVILIIVGIIIFTRQDTYRSVKIESFSGETGLLRDNNDETIFKGIRLVPNDTVFTGGDGEILLLVDSDKHIVATNNTTFSINAEGDKNSGKVSIYLETGKALITIDNKLPENSEFEITTPNVTCGVRGTTFDVEYDEITNTSVISVSEGIVRVSMGDEDIDLEAGQSIIVINDAVYETMIFGEYEQDGDLSNGPEPIEWIVLDKQDGKKLLLSRYILENMEFSEVYDPLTWERSLVREWLNGEFYDTAFNSDEKNMILLSEVKSESFSDANLSQGTGFEEIAGNDTEDKVFILSSTEVQKYFDTIWDQYEMPVGDADGNIDEIMTISGWCSENAIAEGTDYVFVTGKMLYPWWIRNTNGLSGCVIHSVDYQYGYHTPYDGCSMDDGLGGPAGVRPAIWIEW